MKEETWKQRLEEGVHDFCRIIRELIYMAVFAGTVFGLGYLGAQMYNDPRGFDWPNRVSTIGPAGGSFEIKLVKHRSHHRHKSLRPLHEPLTPANG